MLNIYQNKQVHLFCRATDMRKGFDGLALLVKEAGFNSFSGNIFVFLNRRKDKVKILVWEIDGFSIWYKRLEKGRFRLPSFKENTKELLIDALELHLLLDGVDFKKIKRSKRFNRPLEIDDSSKL